MSNAHETCCAHLRIQYCKESLDGLTHDWWECASCKMLFAPQGRASLPQWIPISERLPTREDADDLGYILVRIRGQGGMYEVLHRWTDMPNSAVAWLPLPPYTPPKPEPTDEECKSLWNVTAPLEGGMEVPIMRDYVPDRMRRWFADVTARIEREKQT